MNTELQAMIDAGRKLIAEQATAEQRKTAYAVAEAERLNIRDMLDGKHDGRALDGKSLAQDVRDLDAAKARLKKLLGIEGKITGDALYNLAADEIETLRAQVQEFTADALVRAHRQCIAIDALVAIRERASNESTRQIAAQAVAQIEAVTL